MYDTIYEYILAAKYVSVFVLMALFPTETVMPVVGYAASSGHISLIGAILAGTCGTTLWSVAVYMLARQIRQKTVYGLVDRYGAWLGLRRSRITRAGRLFDRHAYATVFFGRFVPGIRTAVSIPAGFRRMQFAPFVALSALGGAVDSTLLAYLGYRANAQFDDLESIGTRASAVAIVVAAGAVVVIWLRHRRTLHS